MTLHATPQQVFDWAVQLTGQQVYQELTNVFLKILSELPQITKATSYEIYSHKNIRMDKAGTLCEHLIRRFPLDFSNDESDEDIGVIGDFTENEVVKLDKLQADGTWTQLQLFIKAQLGPDRLIVLHGVFTSDAAELCKNLSLIYRNQVLLHDSKERDLLTGLPNRQSFDNRLMQVCQYFRGHPVQDVMQDKGSWIAILDIDFFKSINDNYGHLYGDEVLVIFSQLMEKTFRYNDFLFRYGGEEFIVILNLVNQTEAETAFNRFREVVANYQFPNLKKNVTVSIGVTHIDGAFMPTSLLDRADKSLYYVKRHGRNQVVFHEKLSFAQITEINQNEMELQLF
jgi:diguanylate cyclase